MTTKHPFQLPHNVLFRIRASDIDQRQTEEICRSKTIIPAPSCIQGDHSFLVGEDLNTLLPLGHPILLLFP